MNANRQVYLLYVGTSVNSHAYPYISITYMYNRNFVTFAMERLCKRMSSPCAAPRNLVWAIGQSFPAPGGAMQTNLHFGAHGVHMRTYYMQYE
jgi:hypothetical protein